MTVSLHHDVGGYCGLRDLRYCHSSRIRHGLCHCAKGTPEKPLVETEDLFDAKIINLTPKAKQFGIEIGMTGKEAVELMLKV